MSAINVAVLALFFKKQQNNYIFYCFLTILMANFGHMLIGYSTSTEGVIIANKVNYLGASFLPMFMFFALLQVCRFKINTITHTVIIALSLLVCFLSMSVGYTDWYYTSIEHFIQYGIGNYKAEYGWGHGVFNFMLAFYVIADLVAIIYAYVKRRNVSLKNILAMSAIEIISISSFLISRAIDNDVLVMPMVYVIDQFILIFMCTNISWYDVSLMVIESLEKNNTNAFISFTNRKHYMGSNNIAEKMFPGIGANRVDRPLPKESILGQLFTPILEDLNSGKKITQCDFSYNKKHYNCTIRTLPQWSSSKLYLFRIQDDTNSWSHIHELGLSNDSLKKTVEEHNALMQTMQEQMIVGMASMVESRDNSTQGHIKHSSHVVKILAEKMRKDHVFGLDDEFFDILISASSMHDLGKIALDDSILRKPGRYTRDEFDIMKTHAEKGAKIVRNLLAGVKSERYITIAKNVANYHHERWNGSGYPQKLVGHEIPIEARIMAIADVYDALVSKRCYKSQVSFGEAERIILEDMGTLFDPNLRYYFVSCTQDIRSYYLNADR